MGRMDLFLVGAAPGRHPRHDPDRHALFPYPAGCAGARLMEMMGLTRREYISIPRRNVFREYPGGAGAGDRFPMGEARVRAMAMLPDFEGRRVLFVGKGVGDAFGFFSRGMLDDGTDADRFLIWLDCNLFGTKLEAACVPYLSGRNRWYNNPVNRRAAEKFLRPLGEEHRAFLQPVVRHRSRPPC